MIWYPFLVLETAFDETFDVINGVVQFSGCTEFLLSLDRWLTKQESSDAFVCFWFKCIFECGVSSDGQCLPKFKCVVSEEAEEKLQIFFFREPVVERLNVVGKQIFEFIILIILAFEDWFLHV